MAQGTADAGAWNVGRYVASTLVLFALGFLGLFAISLWSLFFRELAVSTVWAEPLSSPREQMLGVLGIGAGTLMTVAGYLAWTDRDRSFLDVDRPTLRDLGWTAVGLVALFASLYALSYAFAAVGIETSQHTTSEAAADDPALLLPLIPLSILVVGPGEELLYRNVVQKTLYDHAPRWAAILTASVVFAAVHFSAYSTGGGTGALLASLSIVFALSLVLGVVYERTENLVVPALVHGIYNAISFGLEYLEQTGASVQVGQLVAADWLAQIVAVVA